MPCDYTKYPPNWHSEIRPAILARARDRCEGNHETCYDGPGAWCGAVNGEWIQRYKPHPGYYMVASPDDVETPHFAKPVRIVLTVAHLDHDETNHAVQPDRLRALCQRCHLRYDREEKKRRKAGREVEQ